MNDTIYALATAAGRASVAVVRISGPSCLEALHALSVRRLHARRASLRSLRGGGGEILDRALVLWFPAPGSYTGEDCAELHLHGGAAVVDAVMTALQLSGFRLAQPGEFTRRAFENGKMDLGQAEAVADLVDAETEAQARQAMGQLEGALSDRYRSWRRRLVEVLADLEAAVDFPDEELPADLEQRCRRPLADLLHDLQDALADGVRGRRIRDGYRIAIIGAPNAGKSTLFNELLERDAVIVSPLAGTTRDVVETSVVVNGYRLLLADMAGLRDTVDEIEAEGVRRARLWAEAADRRIWVVDQSGHDEGWRSSMEIVRPGDLLVVNKIDLPEGEHGRGAALAATLQGLDTVSTQLPRGGVGPVWRWLQDQVARDLAGADFPATTRARHAGQLAIAAGHIDRALGALHDPELASEDVRLASRALAAVTGSIGVEDVLDKVFASFCIGK